MHRARHLAPLLIRLPVTVALLLALLLVALPQARRAHAATYTVTTRQDAPHTTPLDGACTSILGGSPCTLRAAVQAANFLGGAQTINVPAGTYTLTFTGADEDAAATGDLDLTGTITLVGAGASSTIVDGNQSDRVFEVRQGATVSIAGMTIQNGVAFGQGTAGKGGGILNSGTLMLTDATIRSNRGIQAGGGIENAGTLTLSRVTLSGNFSDVPAGAGGGLSTSGTATLANVTISHNSAQRGGGGGIVNTGSLSLTNTTIVDNRTASGAGPDGSIHGGSGTTLMKNSIVFHDPGFTPNCSGTITSAGGNISSDNTCNFTGPGDRISTDPLLGPLADNGGPTLTHALLPGSPAIDAVLGGCPPPATDQRGVPRPQGAGCDSGAYEAGAVPPTATPTATAILVPTPIPVCTPRPPVAVTVVSLGAGRLEATIGTNVAANARLLALRFGAATGALIDVGALSGQTGNFVYTPPAGEQTTSFFVRQQTPGQAATVPLVVTDSCGDWPTLVGGGPAAFPTATATPTPTGTPTPTVVATATSTPGAGPRAGATTVGTGAMAAATPSPTPTPVCAPRPTLAVATTALGTGRLQVTVTAPASANDRLLGLRFGAATNARITAGGQSGNGSFTAPLAPGSQQTTFMVERVTASQAVTVPLTVVDSCGEWPTVVGGGPSAF